MNYWAQWLAALPPTLQRLIARANRISLPRSCAETIRVSRLRQALCHARTVRETYFCLPPAVQAALQSLRHSARGLRPAELADRYGPLRPLSRMLADRAPQSVSEHLLLLGWLLPRPAGPRHPLRYLLAPELRAWLPQPLQLADHGPAPAPPEAPALRLAVTLLLAAAEQPLPLRQDGTLRAARLRLLAPRLAPLSTADLEPLARLLVPLLNAMGLLAPHGAAAVLAPAGERFLALPPAARLARLVAAWEHAPRPDSRLVPLLTTTHGLNWPLFRRRLVAWADALPAGRLLDPTGLYAALEAAFGPLADAHTHSFRAVDRAPWQPRRAAAIWDAALRGPLAWFGFVAWQPDGRPATDASGPPPGPGFVYRAAAAFGPPPAPATPWHYAAPGHIIVPHAHADAHVLHLLPFAAWHAADHSATTYRITPDSLARAAARGHSASRLWALLRRQAGPLPESWQAALDETATPAPMRLVHGALLLSDDPAALAAAAETGGVRRYLGPRLAPGIALVSPVHAERLVMALERQDRAVTVEGAPPTAAPPQNFTPAETALLLRSCAAARAHLADLPVAALAALEARLWSALPPTLRAATETALQHVDQFDATMPHVPIGMPALERPEQQSNTHDLKSEMVLDQCDMPTPHVHNSMPALERPEQQSKIQNLKSEMVSNAVLCDDQPPPTPLPQQDRTRMSRLVPTLNVLRAVLWTLLFVLLPTRRAAHAPIPPLPPGPLLPPEEKGGIPHPDAGERPAPRVGEGLGRGESGNNPPPPPVMQTLNTLRDAIAHRRILRLNYENAAGTPSERIIRPLRLEQHGSCWYLHAYCTLRQAERHFRIDRIIALAVIGQRARRGSGNRRSRPRLPASAARSRAGQAQPQAGFFPAPPTPPPGSPLLRIWLED